MDSAALLDLLGNENRRRILRLLARKPCYVTEISEYLGVSPKAVIDHLRKLEDAGLVESRVDDQRRKYFSIARNLRLEVNVTPYQFGTKSAYPASPSLDMTACRYLSIDIDRRKDDRADGADHEDRDAAAVDAVDDGGDVLDREGRGDGDGDQPAGALTGDAAGGDDAAPVGTPAGYPEAADLPALAGELERLERLENELSMAQRWVQGRLTEVMDGIAERFGEADGRFYAELLSCIANGHDTPEAIARRMDAAPEMVDEALGNLEAIGVLVRSEDGWRFAE
jgi:ArsR family transcriptional regulator